MLHMKTVRGLVEFQTPMCVWIHACSTRLQNEAFQHADYVWYKSINLREGMMVCSRHNVGLGLNPLFEQDVIRLSVCSVGSRYPY